MFIIHLAIFQSIQNTVENMLGGQANVTISKEEDGTHISDYSLDFVVTHYEQRESSEYYDIVTTYPLADYTSDLAAAPMVCLYLETRSLIWHLCRD